MWRGRFRANAETVLEANLIDSGNFPVRKVVVRRAKLQKSSLLYLEISYQEGEEISTS